MDSVDINNIDENLKLQAKDNEIEDIKLETEEPLNLEISLQNDNQQVEINNDDNDSVELEENSEKIYFDDYLPLKNKPKVNHVELIGDKSLGDFGIVNDKNYIHLQNTASNTWIINHNLNKYPAIAVVDSAGSEVVGDVEYIDTNNLRIKFKGAFKGKATLN